MQRGIARNRNEPKLLPSLLIDRMKSISVRCTRQGLERKGEAWLTGRKRMHRVDWSGNAGKAHLRCKNRESAFIPLSIVQKFYDDDKEGSHVDLRCEQGSSNDQLAFDEAKVARQEENRKKRSIHPISLKKCSSSGFKNKAAAMECTGASPRYIKYQRKDTADATEGGKRQGRTPSFVTESSSFVEMLEVATIGFTSVKVKISNLLIHHGNRPHGSARRKARLEKREIETQWKDALPRSWTRNDNDCRSHHHPQK